MNQPFRVVLARQLLEVSQLCDQALYRGRRRSDERLECVVLGQASLLNNVVMVAVEIARLKLALPCERSHVSDVGFSVGVDDRKDRIDCRRGRQIVGGIGAAVQGWAAYHDWACRNKRPSIVACPAAVNIPVRPAPDSD